MPSIIQKVKNVKVSENNHIKNLNTVSLIVFDCENINLEKIFKMKLFNNWSNSIKESESILWVSKNKYKIINFEKNTKEGIFEDLRFINCGPSTFIKNF